MKRILRDERGMALAVAIFALVVVGALVAGAFFAGGQEQRVGDNTRRLVKSFGVAEQGLDLVIRRWASPGVPQKMHQLGQYPTDSIHVPLTASDSITPESMRDCQGRAW